MGQPAPDRELSALETLMVLGEEDPRTRSSFVVAFTLAEVPDEMAVLRSFDFLSRRVVRFRQRAVLPAVPVGNGRWAVDADFELGYHVRMGTLSAPGSERQVLDAVQMLLMTPLDRARPLWEAQVLTGLQGGRAVALLKFHHAMFDGLGGLQALSYLFQTTSGAIPPVLPPLPGPSDLDSRQVARQDLRELPLTLAAGLSRGTAAAATALWRVARRPTAARAGLAGWGSSVAMWRHALFELFGSDPSTSSPLLRGRGPARRVMTLDIDVDDLKRAGKVAGGSLNDAYMAAVTGAVGQYHQRLGHPIESFPLAMPVSLRNADDPGASNRWSPARLAAPAGETDPRRRIAAIHDLVGVARDRAGLDAVGRVSPLITRLPRFTLPALSGRATGIDVQVSNVPGWDGGDLFLGGAKVVSAHPFGPLPGVAAMVTLLSINNTCHIGVNYDPAAITEPAVFAACMREGFAEIRDLATPPRSAAPRRTGGRRPAVAGTRSAS
jgi:diacylglycerol O-acyltransferase